jgi:hypothetical protein
MLSKTTYLAGLQCNKRLWLEIHQPHLAAPPSETDRFRMARGSEVDRIARQQLNGRLIPHDYDEQAMIRATRQAIEEGEHILFQGTFAADGILVKTDILVYQDMPPGWQLIEVKATTSYKASEHLEDVAVQYHVLRQAGLNVNRAGLMHLNKECVYPLFDNLFTIEDITTAVETHLPAVERTLADMKALLAQTTTPAVDIGRHCDHPHTCPFRGQCWQHVDRPTIWHIPNLHTTKEEELRRQGVLFLADVPADFPLTPRQRLKVEIMLQEQERFDSAAIRQKLAQLHYPLYFLDFETDDPAVPRLDGFGPYQQFPFQYSCHVLEADGRIEHRDYLHADRASPLQSLAQSLLEHIGPAGSIIAYNASFEKRILRQLAVVFPHHAARFEDMAGRLWDQLEIFKNDYHHHAFGGSNSLKSVLPVLVPELNYKELAVQDGGQAQVVWNRLISCQDAAEKAQLHQQLRDYCHLDTLAMVKIHQVLIAL